MALSIEQYVNIEGSGTDYPDSPLLSAAIEAAKESTSINFFGDSYNRAVALRALHILAKPKVNTRNLGGNPTYIDSTVLKISLKYSEKHIDKYPELSSTSFGMALIEMMESTPCVIIRDR